MHDTFHPTSSRPLNIGINCFFLIHTVDDVDGRSWLISTKQPMTILDFHLFPFLSLHRFQQPCVFLPVGATFRWVMAGSFKTGSLRWLTPIPTRETMPSKGKQFGKQHRGTNPKKAEHVRVFCFEGNIWKQVFHGFPGLQCVVEMGVYVHFYGIF